MNLYLDDDMTNRVLIESLRMAGYDVQLPADVGRSGCQDAVHMLHAVESNRVLMTFNHDDFERLHELIVACRGTHPGILVVRRDGDKRDLKPHKIVATIGRLLQSGDPISNHYTILNKYR